VIGVLVAQDGENRRRLSTESWRRARERRERIAAELERLLRVARRYYDLTMEWTPPTKMTAEQISKINGELRDLTSELLTLNVRLRLEGVTEVLEPLQDIVSSHMVFRIALGQMEGSADTAKAFEVAVKHQAQISSRLAELEKKLPEMLEKMLPVQPDIAQPARGGRRYWIRRSRDWWTQPSP
jgi:hypothetical protein